MAVSDHFVPSTRTSFFLLAIFCFTTHTCLCQERFTNAGATWYGGPTGAGSDGGACGYGDAVSKAPFSSFITAVNPTLFNDGKGCGACYQVKCSSNPLCSHHPIRVVVTDLCPGGPCLAETAHFDLSGTAFGALANPGQADNLRNLGVLAVAYRRIPCHYVGKSIEFRVDPGSSQYYFAVAIEFEDGDGDLASVDLKEGSKDTWQSMQHSWGALWFLSTGAPLQAPFSIQLTTGSSGQKLVADNVIPNGWSPGATYSSSVNF